MKSPNILFVVFFMLSCNSSVPEDVLPPNKMQSVLWDMMQADELTDYYVIKDSSYRGLAKHADYYQKIFAFHKISKQDFTRSISYYENNPVKLKAILDSLQKFGERLQKADSTRKADVPVITDSSIRKPPLPLKQH